MSGFGASGLVPALPHPLLMSPAEEEEEEEEEEEKEERSSGGVVVVAFGCFNVLVLVRNKSTSTK
jgi:hypothetical protein